MYEEAKAQYAEDMPVKKKKPNFIRRWLYKISEEAWNNSRNSGMLAAPPERSTIGKSQASIDQPERAIRFTIYNASGGRVVETQRYDRQKDRHVNGLYVITSNQEFGNEIDKIITMEALKQ